MRLIRGRRGTISHARGERAPRRPGRGLDGPHPDAATRRPDARTGGDARAPRLAGTRPAPRGPVRPRVRRLLLPHGVRRRPPGARYDLFALDLRDFGRSIQEGRRPELHDDLATFAEEIDAAVALIRADHDQVALLGHSMGGLITSLWADARAGTGRINALVLNSPWLDLRGNWLSARPDRGDQRRRTVPAPAAVGQDGPVLRRGAAQRHRRRVDLRPRVEAPPWVPGARRLRPHGPARARRVARGLAIDVPVLVLASDRSGPDAQWHDELVTTDSVLDVEQIKPRAPLLGSDVAFVEIAGGAHDLALSPAPARGLLHRRGPRVLARQAAVKERYGRWSCAPFGPPHAEDPRDALLGRHARDATGHAPRADLTASPPSSRSTGP